MKTPAMQFESDGITYRIAFKHETFKEPQLGTIPLESYDPNLPSQVHYIHGRTSCWIRAWPTGTEPEEKPIIGEGIAECAVTDNYNKETGRQTALKRAITNAWPVANTMWELTHQAYSRRPRRPAKAAAA